LPPFSTELAPERELVLDQGPADEEEPIDDEENQIANEDPPVKASVQFVGSVCQVEAPRF
jgi:hypothetical protein